MTSYAAPAAFRGREIAAAALLTLIVEGVLFLTLAYAGKNDTQLRPKEEPKPMAIPIAVKPILDDAPLLKLGGKKKAKLPDMWKKQAPVQRFEEKSAPSAKAEKTPEAIPTSPLALKDAEAPPPDAELAKQVDQELTDAAPDAEPTVEGEGSPDGVKEGTETDPLKARAVDQYRMKILSWFNSRFTPPSSGAPCEDLKKARATVVVSISGDRTVAGYTLSSASGVEPFDAQVRSTLDRLRGEELPPPPPLYPDILGSTQVVSFSGQRSSCE